MTEAILEPWQNRAACKNYPEPFFPPSTHEKKAAKLDREQLARSICAGCVVSKECLEFAVEHAEYGIWGGLNERERRALITE